MGKKTRLALMAFGAGALQGVSNFYQTKAAQEAEALREQRLAAIRAEDRAANQQFQREMLGEQNAAQAERDKRLADQQAARDTAQNEQRMRELEVSGENQLRVAGAYRSPEAQAPTRYLVDRGGRQVEVAGSEIGEADKVLAGITPQGQYVPLASRGGGAAQPAATPSMPASPAANPNPPGTGVRQMVYDEKLGRYVLAPPTG